MNTRERWNRTSTTYDLWTLGDHIRQGDDKRRLFRHARGKTLLVSVGTGADLKFLPSGLDLVGLDISPGMLERARKRAVGYPGNVELKVMDAQKLEYGAASFDTVITSCSLCSIPDPVEALREFHRVLKPGGVLLMFEHMRSDAPVLGLCLDLMTFVSRPLLGPDLNRDTLGNAYRAGFHVIAESNVYLDIVKAARAVRMVDLVAGLPEPPGSGGWIDGEPSEANVSR